MNSMIVSSRPPRKRRNALRGATGVVLETVESPHASARQVVPHPSAWHGGRLGRVANLESFVDVRWWTRLFDANYLLTDGDVFENDGNTRADVDLLLARVPLKPSDRILDLCCGQGRHSIELAGRGFADVVGIDRSKFLIDLAQKRARTKGVSLTFREGDARRCPFGDGCFDAVMILGNSFGYFADPKDDAGLLRECWRLLRPGAVLVLDLMDGDWLREHYQPQALEWIDRDHLVCRERQLSADQDRLVTRETLFSAATGLLSDRFLAERLYGRARIEALLRKLGFDDISVGPAADTVTSRGDDLGMMARRHFVVCRKRYALQMGSATAVHDVTVILGDPRRRDRVKPGGRFGDNDLATIQTLRKALSNIPGYRFTYLDDHATLIEWLRREKPGLVLNLCDEGFDNDPRMEAHVPALLEMLGIPYSGAGPACLAACYDKALVRSIAQSLGVPVPTEVYLSPGEALAATEVAFPALVKPCCGDNSIGIGRKSLVSSMPELRTRLNWLRQRLPAQPLLLQEFLPGAEYSVGAIGNCGLGLDILPILEVDYSGLAPGLPRLLTYESKWDPGSTYVRQIRYREAAIEENRRRELEDQVTALFRRLGCRDYARFDFRADGEGRIKLLEVNPNPGWCWDGKLAIMARFRRISYSVMLHMILAATRARLSISADSALAAGPQARPGSLSARI